MSIKSRKFQKGIRTKPTTDAATLEGEQRTDSADNKQKIFLDSAERAVVTEDQSQDLSNKSIDADNNTISNLETDNLKAGVLNTDLSGAATDTEIPSALAVKTALEGQNEASEINYDNSTSGLAATDVQAAIDEVEGRLDSSETALSDHLVDAVDAHDASAISNAPTGNLVATDVQGALDELQSEIDALPAKSETLQNKTLDSTNTISGSIETPTRLDVKQDTEANLITYAATASDGQLCFATDTLKMYQVITNELQPVGGGGSTSFEITQAAHGLTVGSGIFHNGTIYVDAQANADTTLAYHVVVEVIDANTFVAADFGRIEVPSHGFTVGEYYFQSEATAGLPTTTQPVSGYSNPLFYVETADILQIKCLRPSPVGDTTNLDEIADVSVPAPTDGQALIYNLANLRWEATDVAGTAADITYDNSTSGLTATNTQAAIDEVEARVDTLEAFTPELDGLSDVTITARKDGQVLKYDEAADQIINAPIKFNMLANHEDMTPTLVSVTATKDAAVFLPIDVNTQSMRITFAGSAGSYLQEAPLNSELDGLQGVLRAWVKTDQDNVELSSTIDGVAQSTVTVISTNKWRQYEIPIVMSGTNMGIQISSASSITGNVYLDQVELEIAKASQELGTAHFVGNLNYKTLVSGVFSRSSASYGIMTNTAPYAPEIIGDVSVADTSKTSYTISSARIDGVYRISIQGLFYNQANNGGCLWALSKSISDAENNPVMLAQTSSREQNYISTNIRFDTIGSQDFHLINRNGNATECTLITNSSNTTQVTVHFFPDASSTIVSQDTELTAKTANDLTFTGSYVSGTTTHTLVDDIYGVVGSVTPLSSSGFRVNFASGLFTQTPKVSCEPHDSSGSQARFLVYSINTNSFDVQNYGFSGAVDTFDGSYDCTITKNSADYNKSQTIVGSFEQIENINTELTTETANTFTAKLNGTTCAVESKDYDWITSTTDAGTGSCVVNFSGLGLTVIPSISVHIQFAGGIKYEASANASLNTVTMLSYGTSFAPADPVRYYIRITKQDADFNKSVKGAIVSVSDQATKCQTKYLSANVNTNGSDIADLQFNNLDISKHYNLTTQVRCVAGSVNCRLTAYDGNPASNLPISTTQNQPDSAGAEDRFTQTMQNPFFKPTNTFVTYRVSATSGFLLEGTTASNRNFFTWATLCELPSTVIETDEFD